MMEKLERIHFMSRADRLMPVRRFVRDLVRRYGCCEENLDHMVMAVNEACMNIIQHAYHGVEDGEIIIEFWSESNELLIRIIDFAESVNLQQIQPRDLDDIRPGGLGVYLIHKVMDSVEYRHQGDGAGNVLEMRKKLQKENACKEENDKG